MMWESTVLCRSVCFFPIRYISALLPQLRLPENRANVFPASLMLCFQVACNVADGSRFRGAGLIIRPPKLLMPC